MKSLFFRLTGVLVAASLLFPAGCGGSSKGDSQPNSEATVEETEPGTEAGLYETAQKAERENRPWEAIRLYRRILAEYPESPQNYKAQFLIGFVFSEELQMADSARPAFERVIKDYPDCEFVDDAQAMLNFLNGKEPQFEESSAP